MPNMKQQRWHDLPRQSRLARVLWPQLCEKHLQEEVAAMSRNERKRSPIDARPKDGTPRPNWWETEKVGLRSVPATADNLSRVPGLRRVQQERK